MINRARHLQLGGPSLVFRQDLSQAAAISKQLFYEIDGFRHGEGQHTQLLGHLGTVFG